MAHELHIDPGRPNMPTAREAFLGRVSGLLGSPARHEQIRGIRAALEPWAVAGGLLTPTFKAKRRAAESRFCHEIEPLRARNETTCQQTIGNA